MSELQQYDSPGTHHVAVEVDQSAAADGDKTIVWEAPVSIKLEKVRVIPGAAITGADTNTKHLNLIDRGTNGAGTTEIANYDMTSGNNVGVAGLTLYSPATPLSVAQGNQFGFQVQKVGTGIATPPLAVIFEFSPN